MKIPPFLKAGDKVGIVCTARKLTAKELQPAISFLSECGLIAVLGKTVGEADHQFGGTDQQRAEDFQHMLDNDDIKAIWCARGGYGTVRMIDSVDFSTFKSNPKWIIGYSDPTVLHSHVHNLGVATIHGQMCLEIEKKTESTTQSLKRLLFGEQHPIEFEAHELNRSGTAKGLLIGGNLSILYSILNSESAIDPSEKILFLEDLDEYLYHIDRMMQNLKRSGFLKDLAGLVVGGLTDMNDNTIPFGKTAEEIIAEAVSEYDYPVCFNAPSGHGEENVAMVFGVEYELNVNDTSTNFNVSSSIVEDII